MEFVSASHRASELARPSVRPSSGVFGRRAKTNSAKEISIASAYSSMMMCMRIAGSLSTNYCANVVTNTWRKKRCVRHRFLKTSGRPDCRSVGRTDGWPVGCCCRSSVR